MDKHGVPEVCDADAKRSLQAVYDDIQNVLKAPFISGLFRTLGLYEKGLILAWKEVRPNLLTSNANKAANTLRSPELSVQVPKVDWSLYYEKPTVEKIRQALHVFNDANAKLLLIVSAWAESLSGRPNEGGQRITSTANPGIDSEQSSIRLLKVDAAASSVRDLLHDITERHRHFDLADDFRALALYPQFLRLGWKHLRLFVGTSNYTLLCQQLRTKAICMSKEMPHAVIIERKKLEMFYSPAEIAGFIGIVAMFQQILPTLIVDGEFLGSMLLA